jgi:hypothetical protein
VLPFVIVGSADGVVSVDAENMPAMDADRIQEVIFSLSGGSDVENAEAANVR